MTTTTTQLRPGDPGYDDARLGFQTHHPHTPAAVVVARSAGDVAAAVRDARRVGRRVAVQATGHGVGAVDPEVLLIDTAALDEVTIDPGTRTARAGAGARWGAVIAAAAEHGLAPLSGSSPGVGVAGYLAHGGVALLGRRHGYAAEHVRAFEVVTADGEQRRVTELARAPFSTAPAGRDADERQRGGHATDSADSDDLFWALRGGGGSFAIVTAVEFDLLPLTTVYGGALYLPADEVGAALRTWRDWAAQVPETLSTSAAVIPFPDVDGPPPPLRGRLVLAIRIAYEGADGAARVAPLRAGLPEPLLDGLRELPWAESASIHSDPTDPAASSGTTVALAALPDAVLDAAVATRAAPGPRRVVEFRRLGGAFARPGDGPLRRDAEWSAGTVSILVPGADPAAAARLDADFRAEVAPWTVGRLANFLFGEGADPDAVAAAYTPADLARLRAIRATVDPDGVLAASSPIR